MASELIYRGAGHDDEVTYHSPSGASSPKRITKKWASSVASCKPIRYLLGEQRILFVLVGMAIASVFFFFLASSPSSSASTSSSSGQFYTTNNFRSDMEHLERYRSVGIEGSVGGFVGKVPLGLRRKVKRVVVTGGAGFVGSHLVDRLMERGDNVYPSLPRRSKPRRVDEYYSSWCIRTAESRQGGMTGCEVILFHHENMGIPWELAKLGVRQGMWGTVKKIEPGLRAYQMSREAGEALSRYAIIAGINTNVSTSYLKQLQADNANSTDSDVSDDECENDEDTQGRHLGKSIPRFLVVGGAVVLAFTLDRGLLTKALIFGVARKFAKAGR